MSDQDEKKTGEPSDFLSVPPSEETATEDSWDLDEFAATRSAPPVDDATLSPYTLEPTFNTGATSKIPDPNPDIWESRTTPTTGTPAEKSVAPSIAGDDWDLDEFGGTKSTPPVQDQPASAPVPAVVDDAGDGWDLGEFNSGGSVPPAPSISTAGREEEPVALADEEPVAMAPEAPVEMVQSRSTGDDDWDMNEFAGSPDNPPSAAPLRPLVDTPPLDPALEAATGISGPVPAAETGSWEMDEFSAPSPEGIAPSEPGTLDDILDTDSRSAYLDTSAAPESWSVQPMSEVGERISAGSPDSSSITNEAIPAGLQAFFPTGNPTTDSVLSTLVQMAPSAERDLQMAAIYVAACGQKETPDSRFIAEARKLIGEKTSREAATLRTRIAVLEDSSSDELERLGSTISGGPPARTPWIAEALRRSVAEGSDERSVRLAWALAEIDPSHPLARWVQARNLPPERLPEAWEEYLRTSSLPAAFCERARLVVAESVQGRETGKSRMDEIVAGLRNIPPDHPLKGAAQPLLVKLLEISGNWSGWVEVMRMQAASLLGTERTALLYRVARVLHEELGQTTEAGEIYRQIRLAEPENLLVLKLLEDVERRAGRPKELLEVFDAQYKAFTDSQLRAITAVKAGQVADEMLKDPQAAIEWYSRALEVDPRNSFALSSIGRLFARAGEWEKLAQVYEFEAEGSPDRQQKIDYMIKHAELLADKLGQRKMAIEVLRTALLTDDSNLNIYRELGRLLYAEQQWEDLIRLYQAEATLTRDKSRLIAIYMSLGELWQKEFTPSEPVDKFAMAVESYYHALEVEPDYTPALRTLGRLFHSTQNWDLLIRVFEREIELVDAPRAKAAIFIKIAEIAEDRKRDLSLAIDYLRKALELDPENQMVINLLSRLAPTQKNWDDLVQVYIREAQLTKDPRYAAALHQLIGELWRDRFKFAKKSNESFQKAVELDRGLVTARKELEENLESQMAPGERIAQLSAVLSDRSTSPATDGDLYIRLLAATPSEITDERLASIPDSLTGRALLALEPVLDQRRLRLLSERVASTGGDESALARSLLVELPGTDEIAETAYVETLLRDGGLSEADLERLYARIAARKPSLGHWELKASLRERIEGKAESLDDLIWEGIGLGGTSSRLLPLLARRVEAGGANAGIIEALRHAARDAGDTAHELMAVEALFELSLDARSQEPLLEARARTLAAMEGRQEEALVAARELFKVNPDNPVAESLITRLSTELGRTDDARMFAERKLTKAVTSAEKASAKTELARICLELDNNPQECALLIGEALELDPGCVEARRLLVTLHERQSNIPELAEALEVLISMVPPEEALRIRERLVSVYADTLREPERQLLHLEELCRIEPESPHRWAALAKFHRIRSDWTELSRSLVRQAQLIKEDEAQAERLMSEAARIAVDRHMPEQDIETIYKWAHQHVERAADMQTVLGIAIDTARALECSKELAALLERRAASQSDTKKQVADLVEAAKLYEMVLDRADKAQELYTSAAELDDTHPAALMAQAEKLFRDGEYAKALPVIRKAFGAGVQKAEARVRSEANYMLGVCLQQTGDAEQARGAFQRVLEDEPEHRDALLALAEFDGLKEDWQGLAQKLEMVIRGASDTTPEFRANLWSRVAHAMEKAGRPDDALRAFESVVRENPSSDDALQAVARISTARGYLDRANTALDALATQAEALMENQKAAKYRLEIARNLERHLGDPAQALVEYRRTLDLDGNLPEALIKVAESLVASGRHSEAEDLLGRLAKLSRLDPKLQATASALLGKVAIAKGDSAAAQNYLEQAAQQGTDTSGAAEEMIALYEKNGEWDKAAQMLEKLADSLRKDNPRASLPFLRRRAMILKDRLNRRDDAVMEIRRSIRLDPQNIDLHETLAGMFRENVSTLGEAIKSYQALLQIDPYHAHTYQMLGTIYGSDLDKRYCAGQALAALGIATSDVTDFVAAQRTNQPLTPKTKLNPASHGKQFWHPFCQHYLQEILPLLAPVICKTYPMDFVKLGVKPDPMPAGMIPEAIKQVMEQIGPVEGLIFVRDNRRPLNMTIERGPKGPVVLVGDQLFETLTGAEATFMAARTLFALVDGSWSLARLDADTVHRLLALFGRSVDETFRMGGDPAAIKRDVKNLDKEISRNLRKELQAKLSKFREAHSRVAMPAWLEGMQYTRDRFGLVMAGDLLSALTRVAVRTGAIQEGPLPEPSRWPEIFKDRPQFGELLRYSVSEEYFLQRRQLGMSIDSL